MAGLRGRVVEEGPEMLPAQAFWNCEMEAPRQERSIESPDRAGLRRRCFLTLILESHCASPRNPPAGPERVRSRDAFGSRRAARLTVPRSPKQLLPCTGEPRLVCRASGLVSVIRSNATDRHGSGRGTWLVEGSFLRIVESLRRPRLEAWRRCALERLARWGLYAPQEG